MSDDTTPANGSAGEVLGGRYELGAVLGHGGMAEVRQALDLRLGRQVAIKMLRPDLARDPSYQARFRREAQSAAALNAPSIVAVYDTGEDTLAGARVPYIVMEYVEGQTLRQVLTSGERLLPHRALEIIDGVLAALDYSHRNGIVHRDVKPANVMLTAGGDVKVMDFGIARAVADSAATMTHTATVLGTAQYLSPEQARGDAVDQRSDVYSAGCLLYELLTGRPPFQGESPVAVAYQHVRENPAPPSTVNPDLSPGIDAIVMKALAKNPENRYQTAQEMRDDIGRAQRGATVVAPPVMADAPTQQLGAATQVLEPVEEERPQRKAAWYVGLLLATLAVLALLGFAAYAIFGGGGDKVRVPDVRGMTLNEATAELEAKGLVVGETTPASSEEPKNTVLAQNPPPQTEIEEGSTVDLTISSGPEQVEIPTLVGLDQASAISELQRVGLFLGRRIERASDQASGTVINSRPVEGTLVDVGSKVDLVISTGEVEVPNVVGDTEAQATATLTNAGFDVQRLTQEDAEATPGTVLAQSPAADSLLRLGSTVTITIATAPPSPSPTPTEETTAPGNSGNNNGNDNGPPGDD